MPENASHFKRNFTFGILNGTFFMAALAFVAGSTVLPVFISKLTASRTLIGIISHVEWFGWMFPQLFAAAFLAHRKKALGFYNSLSAIRLSLFAMVILSIFIFSDNFNAILIIFGIGFTIFSLSSGFAGIAFMEVVGKAIPVNRRGSFFGWRMFSGGLLAALSGLVVRRIMAVYQFPYDFGYTCVIAWILMFLGLSCFAMLKEPENIDPLTKARPGAHLKNAVKIYKNNKNLRKLIFSKGWVNSSLMAVPFYVIFAMNFLGAADWMAGIYLTVQMVGYLGSNLLWGWLSNRVSNRLVILLSSFFRMLSPLIAFAGYFIKIDPYVFSCVFLFLGMAEAGIDMGYMNYMLEISPDKGRPLYIGLIHTLIAPTVLFAGLGGWLSEIITLKWLFAVVFVTIGISIWISSTLKEPRSLTS
jgi:MFS family permease